MKLTVVTNFQEGVAEIVLAGELDASTAGLFQEELTKAASFKPISLVLRVQDLTFMASAGIRMLIFAKQKMGSSVTVYVVAPQEPIRLTLIRTGLQNSVTIQDEFMPLP